MNQGFQASKSAHPARRSALRALLLALALLAAAGEVPLHAQLGTQYTAPGVPSYVRYHATKDEFQKKLLESPWKAGALRLSPWLGLRDASFVNLLTSQGESGEEDFTLTVGAGLRGYLPAGSKFMLAAHALPEYVWWTDNDAKRRLNGRYGLGAFFFFNRMTIELSHRRLEQQGFFSSEVQTLTSSRSDVSTLSLDLELTPKLSLFGFVTNNDYANVEDESVTFSALDRIEDNGMVGLRYLNPKGWTLELSHIDRSSDFEPGARGLSNSGTSEVATIAVDRPGIGFRLTLAANDREGDEGSEFGSFDDPTGSFDVLWKAHRSLVVLGYARRDQTYSIDDRYGLIVADRQGARLNFAVVRATLGVFAEVGEDNYVATSLGVPNRVDDVTGYGGELQVQLKGAGFRMQATRTEYDAPFEGLDRDVTQVSFAVNLAILTRATARLVEKLSLGNAESDW